MALASRVRGRMLAEMNAASEAKIARNDPSRTKTDRRQADDATLTNTWQQQIALGGYRATSRRGHADAP